MGQRKRTRKERRKRRRKKEKESSVRNKMVHEKSIYGKKQHE